MVEMGTFVAILLGSLAGGLLVAVPAVGPHYVAWACAKWTDGKRWQKCQPFNALTLLPEAITLLRWRCRYTNFHQLRDTADEAVLALLYLTLHDGVRAWKGHDWDALDRLYQKGMIDNPVGKAKSVVLTDEGLAKSERLFRNLFERSTP